MKEKMKSALMADDNIVVCAVRAAAGANTERRIIVRPAERRNEKGSGLSRHGKKTWD